MLAVEVGVSLARLLLVIAVALPGRAIAGPAQPEDADAAAPRIFAEVMSPYCPGKLLADCTSPAAFDLRAEIRARLAAGETPTDVENSLYARFGDHIRATPPARRWGLVLWIAPPIVLAISLAWLVRYLAHGRQAHVVPRRTATDAALERRLDEELADL